jgi:GH24 family phage-related lysozyme (muramidase)
MPEILSDLPRLITVLVRREFTQNFKSGHGEYLEAHLLGVRCQEGTSLQFQVRFQEPGYAGAMFCLPLQAICWQRCKQPPVDLLQPWDTFSSNFTVHEFRLLRNSTAFSTPHSSLRSTGSPDPRNNMLDFISRFLKRSTPGAVDLSPGGVARRVLPALCGPRALALILEFEGLDQPWQRPPGESGITIGIGFDLGYCTENEFRQAWERHLDSRSFLRLHTAIGKTGSRAAAIERDMMGCQRITKEAAYEVFERCTLPKWTAAAAKTFPGLEVLTPDQQGVLVSLVFNRGPSLAGPRRREMANIRDILANPTTKNKPSAIAQQLRDMCRLWPDVPGLQRRRTAEATLMTS